MTPVPLGDDRLLVLYNRRYDQQGILACVVRLTEQEWIVEDEQLVYDAQASRDVPTDAKSGVDELVDLQFGFPTAIRLRDGGFLMTHWSLEKGRCGIRWTRLRIQVRSQ